MRCFVSVNVDDKAIVGKIKKFQEGLKYSGINLVPQSNFHFTLRFLGEIDHQTVNEAIKMLEGISYGKFNMELKGVGVFPNERMIRVIWIGSPSSELIRLAELVNSSLADIGKSEENFIPHLTVARVKYIRDREALLNYISSNRDAEFGNMNVNEFSLMKSELTPRGPIYTELKKFNLLK